MFKNKNIVIIALLLCINFKNMALFGFISNLFNDKVSVVVNKVFNNISELNIDEKVANIEIVGTSASAVEIEYTRIGLKKDIESVVTNFDAISKTCAIKNMQTHDSVKIYYKIKVPQNSNCIINCNVGNVSVAEVDGVIKLNCKTGNVSIEGGQNYLDVQLNVGKIDFKRKIQSKDVNLEVESAGQIKFFIPALDAIFHCEVVEVGTIDCSYEQYYLSAPDFIKKDKIANLFMCKKPMNFSLLKFSASDCASKPLISAQVGTGSIKIYKY